MLTLSKIANQLMQDYNTLFKDAIRKPNFERLAVPNEIQKSAKKLSI